TLPDAVREAIIQRELGETVGSARGATPTMDELQEHLRRRRIHLEPDQVRDPAVQAKILCARAVAEAAWGDKTTVLRTLAARFGRTEITIRRWVDEVETWRIAKPGAGGGVVPLSGQAGAPGPRIELPKTKKFAPEALAYGIQIYAGNIRSGQKAAYAALCQEADRRGWAIGDYTNFTRAVGKIPDVIWDGIRKGSVGWEKDYIPKILRAWLKVPVMTVLCGDQHIFDYQVFDPAMGENGGVMTPECYVWMDCTSRFWAGVWPEFGHYNSFTLGASLREGCRFGLPDEIFTDWGKPENSKYVAQLVEGLSGYSTCGGVGDYRGKYSIFDDEESEGGERKPGNRSRGTEIGGRKSEGDGDEPEEEGDFSHRRARAGVPWLKPIENQFNVLERDLADRFLVGYRHRDADAWVNKQRNAELKRARMQGRLLSIEEFVETFWDVVSKHNANIQRPKECPAGFAPQDVFLRGLAEQMESRVKLSDDAIDALFRPRYLRKPRQGIVEVALRRGDKRCYRCGVSDRERVWVSVDPYDLEAPAAFYAASGEFMGLGEPWNIQDPRDVEGLRKKLIRQAELRRWWREQIRQVREGWGLTEKETITPTVAAPKAKVTPIGGESAARRADAEAKALKPKVAQAGKKLEAMFDRMQGE
ncbi:MAG: hypothetical protein AB7W37_06485, partial [Syntrophobacteraceae bacterium]